MRKLEGQIGLQFSTKECGTLEIVGYNGAFDVTVKFIETGFTTTTQMSHIRLGNVKDPLAVTRRGVGFIGIGPHRSSKNTKPTPEYDKWSTMIERCYNPTITEKYPTYSGCSVDKQWYNFQEFAEWCQWQKGFNKNTGSGKRGLWQLDKDVLCKGNKVYSPETCCFIPQEINTATITGQRSRGDLPIGVREYKYSGYISRGSDASVGYLGIYPTIEEAFYVYKVAKEGVLRRLADKYREDLEDRVYHALLNYKVDITD